MKQTVKFVLDRETKGAVLYQEVDQHDRRIRGDSEGAKIGQFYVRKWWLPNGAIPKSITMELDV